MFSKLLDKFRANKRNILWIIVGVSLFFVLSDSVFAADAATATNTAFEKAKATAGSAMSWIGATIAVFLSLLTYLTTIFLSPEWINGSLFGLNTYFKDIWILISNVVYLVFAFILIWIAFMNIIGKGQEKYALKQALPKFIVGILIVPFSWFLVQFILSLSAVLTISALNLPFETFPTFGKTLATTTIPKSCTVNLKSIGKNDSTATDSTVEEKGFIYCDKDLKTNLSDVLNSGKSSDSIFGIIATYTYGVLGLENISNMNANDLTGIKTMGDLVVKLLFDVLFVVVYSILMIALGLVLMVRGIYIWIYIMISPIFGLMYFFDKTSGGGEFFDKFNIKQFISLAMVPVFSMLALTFGLLFMYVVGNGMTGGGNKDGVDNVIIKEDGDKGSKITIGGTQGTGDGGFSLSIIGSPANSQNITGFMKNAGNDTLGVIGTLIMKIFGIVVLWGAVMAALRSNEMTKAIVEPLHAFGTQVGGLITKAPQYAPIFGGQSMQSMSQIGSAASNYYTNTLPGKKSSEFMQKHGLFGNDKTSVDSTEIRNALNSGNLNNIGPAVKKALVNAGEANIASNREELISSLLEVAKKLDPNGIYKDKKVSDIKGNGESFVKLNQYIDEQLTNKRAENADIFADGHPTAMSGNTSQYNEWLRRQKDGANQTQSTGNTNQTQTINLNIKNDGLNNNLYTKDTSGKIIGVTDAQAVASHISETNLLTREQFIDEFVKKLITEKGRSNITDENAKKIAEEVANKITNFKTN
ncbi:MAG: hypothetical protein PHH98_02510 [Candidatus Gracilibacteria bacterium]|nr:hypothetical protein [Candidatus Gracilibacteria bacterium]